MARDTRFKAGERVRMKEDPCGQCPPWTRRKVARGSTGEVAGPPTGWRYAYEVKWDGLGERSDVCPRHLEAEQAEVRHG